MGEYVARLDTIGLDDVAEVGGKGANLGELIRAGFKVPCGFSVKVSGYDSFLAANGLLEPIAEVASSIDYSSIADIDEKTSRIRAMFESAEIPGDIKTEITEAYLTLQKGDDRPLVAIRSSVATRDRSRSSFPGQMDTYHNVMGADEVLRRVKECWASVWTSRAASTLHASGIGHELVVIAPVVQLMIPSDTAGVLFTSNPANGSEKEMMINAAYGLGEAVVSGRITPDEYVVEKDSFKILEAKPGVKHFMIVLDPEKGSGNCELPLPGDKACSECLSDRQVEEISALGLKIEKHYCEPQDVEWAYKDGELYLLQSRRIAGIDRVKEAVQEEEWVSEFDTKVSDPPDTYTSSNLGEVLPDVLTPISIATLKVLDYGFWDPNYRMGTIEEPFPESDFDFLFLGFFYGRAHLNLTTFKNMAAKIPGASAAEFERGSSSDDDAGGESVTKFSPKQIPFLLKFAFKAAPETMTITWKLKRKTNEVKKRIKKNRGLDLTKLKISEFARLLEFNHQDSMDIMSLHIMNSELAVYTFEALCRLTERWLGDENGSLAARLITGLSTLESAKPGLEIGRLYEVVKASSTLKEIFENNQPSAIREILNRDSRPEVKQFDNRLNSFLDEYGYRSVSEAEIMVASWEQDPSYVFSMIKNYLKAKEVENPREIEERQRKSRLEATRESMNRLGRVKRMMFKQALSSVHRFLPGRENNKAVVMMSLNESKRFYLEINRRLIERGVLKEEDDIYFLTRSEVVDICRGKNIDAADKIPGRKEEFRRNKTVELPDVFTGRPHPVTGSDSAVEDSSVLKGLPVSPGRVTGPARVILDPRQDPHIETGEILVVPVTDASWTPLFLVASAIVVDIGGLLSHGSVIAREYGIPGVLNVQVGTKVIKTGQIITVDGTRGEVLLCPEEVGAAKREKGA